MRDTINSKVYNYLVNLGRIADILHGIPSDHDLVENLIFLVEKKKNENLALFEKLLFLYRYYVH